MTKDETIRQRFWSKVDKSGPNGCWLWAGYINPKGYAGFHMDGRNRRGHRVAYLMERGNIPEGKVLDHLCRVRHCVNPSHLEAVTNRDNILRGNTIPAAHAAKTKCPKGHPYNLENTKVLNGQRFCRMCAQSPGPKFDSCRDCGVKLNGPSRCIGICPAHNVYSCRNKIKQKRVTRESQNDR